MHRFAPALRRVARELDLPRAVRAPILLEMAADLEAMYEHHRGRGVGEDEAARLAEETVLGSSEVVRRLARLHAGSLRGWSREIGGRLGRGADLVLLLVGVLPIFVLAAGVTVQTLVRQGSGMAWVVVVVGLVLAARVAVECGRLLGAGRRPLRAPDSILVLSALAPALGALALVLGLYSTAIGLMNAGPDPNASAELAAFLVRDGAVFVAGLMLGIAGALAWFVLVNREAVRAAREVDRLLESGARPAARPGGDGIVPLTRRRQA